MSDLDISAALEVTPTRLRERISYDRGRLIASRCTDCRATTWPPRALCAKCGSSSLEVSDLPPTAVVQSWTTVWTPLPGIEAPYVMGLLDMGGVRIFGHLRGIDEAEITTGTEVGIRVDPDTVPHYWFEKESDS
jgi:uncharacterized protein